MSSQPRLLLFTLDPRVESVRRRLLPGRSDHLGRQLLRRTMTAALDAGRAAGCHLEVSSPRRLDLADDVFQARQEGRRFGDRLRHALREAHGRTRGAVVVVGSDVPGLSKEHVVEALDALEDSPGRVVIGPSPDGGFYLLAASSPLDEELSSVHWCAGDTMRTLVSALETSGREVVLLAPLRDLDRPQELTRWLARESSRAAGWGRWVRILRRFLAELVRPASPLRLGRALLGPSPVSAGRGPPHG